MSLESGLETEFSSISRLAGKVFPLRAPKGTIPPYTTYNSSVGRPEKSLNGYENLVGIPIELSVVTKRYEELKPLTAAVVAKLESIEGRTTIGGVYVQEVTYQEPVELFESVVNMYRCVIETRFYVER